MPKLPLRILFYAINGTGLGHITRLNNIATDAAFLCREIGIDPRFEFITTSDAPFVVTDFISTKFPSKTTIRALGLPIKSTTASIKAQIVSHISSRRPDALVMDTNPKGSYSEFSFIRCFATSTVFIDRARKKETVDTSTQKHIAMFDKVICPERSGMASFPLHPNITYAGKIHGFKPEYSYDSDYVRDFFGAKAGQRVVYLTSGGGGDPMSEEILEQWVAAIKRALPNCLLVVGYGPLFKGNVNYSDRNIVPYTGTNISRFFKGFDFAISAAGYNAFEELQAARVPTIYFSLAKGMDDQEQRIRIKEKQGLCLYGAAETAESDVRRLLKNISSIRVHLDSVSNFEGSVLAAKSLIETAIRKKLWNIDKNRLDEAANKLIETRVLKNNQLTLSSGVAA